MRYETVIHVINEGVDRFDAGERAGAIIENTNITPDMTLSCEPTRIYLGNFRKSSGSAAGQGHIVTMV